MNYSAVFENQKNPEIIVTINRRKPDERKFTFSNSFRIGRLESCEVQLQDAVVSAHHVDILLEHGNWWIHDVHSTNGTFLNGELIHKAQLKDRATIQLGKGGPVVSLRLKDNDSKHAGLFNKTILSTIIHAMPSATQIWQHYLSQSAPSGVGHYTIFLRNALNQALKKRAKKFLFLLAIVSLIAAGALALVWYQHKRLAELEPLGTQIFYSMKALELQIAGLIESLSNSPNHEISEKINDMQLKYQDLQKEYDRFVEELGIYDDSVNEKDQIILRIARIFGECELNVPEDFVDEVNKYIKKWQSTTRLQKAIGRSIAYRYHKTITEELLANHLPPQFFYLALQESEFDVNRCGPKTRYGIAKGMWQFIPRTAVAYGLKVGPLRRLRRPDPRDERHNFVKSTQAAVRLIRDLYNTKAQGSGLLVLASYNWGIGNLQELIDQMPPNPKDRNFWQLVKNYKIPKQTYDFVFYIVSAAVIGENPKLFGFRFRNPLADVG
ncbi:MAG: FHA domain-containing protein [bacterium]